MPLSTPPRSRPDFQRLRDVGYVVLPRFVPDDALEALNRTARVQLAARADPLELEADLQYPGAPPSRAATGGTTVRRLLDAYGRHPLFAERGTAPALRQWLEGYFGESVRMSRAHHNCLMTKHPRYGSLTGWHRDIRYWSFERDDLVSVWMALGEEQVANGALWFVPGSHRMELHADRFDEAKFLRPERADNAAIIQATESPRLDPGDAVIFHCNTLHSAGRNLSNDVKFSLVFTYHGSSNSPVAGTRSMGKPEVDLGPAGRVLTDSG